MAELTSGWLAGAKREDIVALMLTPELDGSAFIAWAVAVPRLPLSNPNDGQRALSRPSAFVRVQSGLTVSEPVELVGGSAAVPAGGRLISDEGDVP